MAAMFHRLAGHIHLWNHCVCGKSYCSKCVGGKCPQCKKSYYAEDSK